MELPVKTVKLIHHLRLEEFVKFHYGIEIDIHRGDYPNGFLMELGDFDKDTDPNEPWEYWDSEIARWLQERNDSVDLDALFNDMAKRGLIEVDDYAIEIWW